MGDHHDRVGLCPGTIRRRSCAIIGFGRWTVSGEWNESDGCAVIFITAKFRVSSPDADRWPAIVADFTAATRAEPGCLWFEWSRSLDDPTEYVLVEAFRDADAGAAHVASAHFAEARRALPPHLAETPRIVNVTVPGEDWSRLGEMEVTPEA